MSRSNFQQQVKELVQNTFPNHRLKEEVYLGEGLYLDLLLLRGGRDMDIGIEVQGVQHYTPNTFFHKDEMGWLNQRRNDVRKKQLCVDKNILLIEFHYQDDLTSQVLFDKIYVALDDFIPY